MTSVLAITISRPRRLQTEDRTKTNKHTHKASEAGDDDGVTHHTGVMNEGATRQAGEVDGAVAARWRT